MIVQYRLKSKFTEYSKLGTTSQMSGQEIAQKMLRDNGIYDVQVTLWKEHLPITTTR
jgi:Zn-dependent membrane protease YugP